VFSGGGAVGVGFAGDGLEDGGPASPIEDRGLRRAKSTDKIAGWDQEDEDSKARYKEAWLKKGARERERDREHQGESSGSSQREGKKASIDDSDVEDADGAGREEYEQGPSGDEPSVVMENPPPYSGP